ncbi:MAG: CDP-diacylglycerol--serine O-phosphatidyltransferase [Bacteroidales bacterium]
MKFFTVPNIITLLNLTAGCTAIVLALSGEALLALLCILTASLLDFFDGFIARLLNAYSAIGKELDSLADLVSFGVAPAAMIFYALSTDEYLNREGSSWLATFSIFLVLFSALRLAKFNIDDRQNESFLGLPTPANALFFGSIAFLKKDFSILFSNFTPYIIVGAIFVFSYLLISELPMFSLKIKEFSVKKYYLQLLLLLISLLLIIGLKISAIPIVIGIYIIFSLIAMKSKKT